MTRQKLLLNAALALVAVGLTTGMGAYVRHQLQPHAAAGTVESAAPHAAAARDGTTTVRVGIEARKNMGLISLSLQPSTYFRQIAIPGVVTARPGVSDRGVVAPIAGVVSQIHALPGDAVEPGSPLVTLRLMSESLQTSQLELFKATKEIDIARKQRQRLDGLAADGSIAGSRIIEIDNQMQRMEVNVRAYRQDLRARGLSDDQIEAAAKGEFVTEITLCAPSERAVQVAENALAPSDAEQSQQFPYRFELQALLIELGQHVAPGAVLCSLADHRVLLIEGHGFKKDIDLVQRVAKERLPIAVDFDDSEAADWPTLSRHLVIDHVANLIDTPSRTFAFYLLLENQGQTYSRSGRERWIWRFRPGDRANLSVTVAEIENVFVLPQAALVREGPEAFVFRQNGDLFDRIAVHVLHEDRTSVVLANDGKLRKGAYLAQNAAATLNRVLKAQLASGQPTNLHVHADGTTHAAH